MSRPKSGETLASKFLMGPGTPQQGKSPANVPRIQSQDSLLNSRTPSRRPGFFRSPYSSPKVESNLHSVDSSFLGDHEADMDPELSQNDVMKRRLVEQFYKMDGKSRQRSSDTLGNSSAFGGPLSDLNKFSGSTDREVLQARDFPRWSSEIPAGTGAKIVDIGPFDDGILGATDCTDMLLDIEGFKPGFELENLSYILEKAIVSVERPPRFSEPLPSGTNQLLQVEEHLRDLQVSVDEIVAEFANDISAAKSQYHDQTQRSMEKVTRLAEHLQSLTTRVDSAKAKMARNRELLERDIAGKIATLELVSTRFREHDKKVRKRRGQQVVASLCLLMLALGVYMALNGFSCIWR